MSKINQMEMDRRKSDERIRQLEGMLQSYGRSAPSSPNVASVGQPMYASPSFQSTPVASLVQPPPVIGMMTPQSYSSVTSGGPPVAVGDGNRRKVRERHRPVGCPACRQPDGTVALSCSECRRQGCYNCGSLDHWKRDCPIPRKTASTPPGAYSKGANAGQSHGQVYLTMVIGSQSTPCLIDTGCELSLAPLKLVNDVQLTATDQRVYAANGSDIRIRGATRLQFLLNGLKTQADVLVTEDVEEPMLGIDWLVEHQCYWDFRRSLLYVDGRPMEMRGRRARNLCRRVYVTEEVRLPPRHQGDVPARSTSVSLRDVGSTWALESRQLRPGVLVARSVMPDRHHDVAVRLLNVTNRPQTVRSGTCVGVLRPVDVCCVDDGRPSSQSAGQPPTVNCRTVNQQGIPSTITSRVAGVGNDTAEPDPFEEMISALPPNLDADQRRVAESLLRRYEDTFSKSDYDLGQTDLVMHRIDTGDNRPFRQPLRRHPVSQLPIIDEHVDQMLRQGIVEPAASPWSSNVVLVRRKDNKYRFCIDYRRLNAVTYQDVYPLPRIESCLDALNGAGWFSTLDLRSGYWQVRQDPRDADKTAFITRRGCFRFRVMSFGLTNAPSVFQRLMDLVLAGLTWDVCLVYLDDVIVFSSDFEEHTRRLEIVLQRLRAAQLKLKPSKCEFFSRQVKFLGHVVSDRGVQTDPEKIAVVKDWPVPRCLSELRTYLGFCSYYRRFVRGFADIAAPLHELTKKGRQFVWTERCQQSFDELKERLTSSPVLAQPRHEGSFVLDTDASLVGVGAVLSQVQDGEERVIAYSSRLLSDAERRYSTTRLELLAAVYGLRQYRQYLLGRHFTLRTDHAALQWLRRVPEPVGQQARWLDLISEFTFDIQHRPGSKHNNADGLSRRPPPEAVVAVVRGSRAGACDQPLRPADLSAEPTPAQLVADIGFDAEHWTPEELGRAQAADPAVGPIYRLLSEGQERPSIESLLPTAEETESYWTQWELLTVVNGVLYRRFIDADGRTKRLQLIAPAVLRSELVRLCHTGMTGGHLGFRKTVDQVARRAYWTGYRSDVQRFCRRCQECTKYHRGAPPRNGPLQSMTVGMPMERWAIDLTGPHPRSRHGKVYILTAIDCFTRYVEAVAIPNKEATTVARALVENVFCRYGLPLQLLSDQGKEFDNTLLQELCRLLGVDKVRTSAYKASTNGCVERFHRTLNAMIGRVVTDSQKEWDEILPFVMAAYRSSTHESTGHSPNFLMYGREARAPVDVVLGTPPSDTPATADAYADELYQRLVDAYRLVREQLGLVAVRSKQHYDLRVRPVTYTEGQWVWIYHPRRRVGRSPKWQRWYTGPFVVEKAFNDVLYRVRRSPKAKPIVVHVDKMKPCLEPPTSTEAIQQFVSEAPGGSVSGLMDNRPRREIRRPARYLD